MQEQAEAEYRRRFPNHFAAFADLAEDDLDLADDPPAQQSVLVTASQASSSQAQALLTGEFLDDIVQLHMSLFPVNPEPAGQPDSISKQEAFVRAYDLAARAVQTRGEGQQLWLEASSAPGLAGGLLLRVCMTHQSLAAAPTQEPLPGKRCQSFQALLHGAQTVSKVVSRHRHSIQQLSAQSMTVMCADVWDVPSCSWQAYLLGSHCCQADLVHSCSWAHWLVVVQLLAFSNGRCECQLTEQPNAAGRGSLDVQKAGAAVGEAELLLDPLGQLQERLRQLLADWPEHPLLSQLLAICTRIQSELPHIAFPHECHVTVMMVHTYNDQCWR